MGEQQNPMLIRKGKTIPNQILRSVYRLYIYCKDIKIYAFLTTNFIKKLVFSEIYAYDFNLLWILGKNLNVFLY